MTLLDQEFNSVLTGVVFANLHREHIDKVYRACSTFKTMIDDEWKMIYHDCQHHQPHNPGEHDEPVIDDKGTQRWYREGKQHRDGDRPAEIWDNGSQYWYSGGIVHRDGDLPAVIWGSGSQWWFKYGKKHRDGDKPAVIKANGDQLYYHNDLM